MNMFNLSAAEQTLTNQLLAALRDCGLDPHIWHEDGHLYLKLSDSMRGSLTQLLAQLRPLPAAEVEAAMNQIVKNAVLVATNESPAELTSDQLLTRVYAYVVAATDTEITCDYGVPLAGELEQILALDTPTGPVPLSDSASTTLSVPIEELQQQGIKNLSDVALVEIAELDAEMTCLIGESPLFASRILDLDSLLKEAGIKFGPLGVFCAAPCATALVVLPVRADRVWKDATALITYVGGLLSDPEFTQARGVLSEYVFHWDPALEGATSITCIEQERVIDGEEYIEVVMPPVLAGFTPEGEESQHAD